MSKNSVICWMSLECFAMISSGSTRSTGIQSIFSVVLMSIILALRVTELNYRLLDCVI